MYASDRLYIGTVHVLITTMTCRRNKVVEGSERNRKFLSPFSVTVLFDRTLPASTVLSCIDFQFASFFYELMGMQRSQLVHYPPLHEHAADDDA